MNAVPLFARLKLPACSALFLLPILFLVCMLSVFADSDPDLEAANRAYTYGSYDESAQLLQKIIDTRGYSAPLCFNLANAESRAGHTGLALLNYERARYLAPTASDIDHNLQHARQQAGLEPNSYRWWQTMLRTIDWTVWLILIGICVALLILALVSTTRKDRSPTVRTLGKAIFFFCIPLTLLFGFIELLAVGYDNRIEGVIVAPKQAILYLSPFSGSDQNGTIPEGELVTVENRRSDYLYIEARNKHFGWVEKKDLEPIVPGDFDISPAQ